jgi:hypothetical protein
MSGNLKERYSHHGALPPFRNELAENIRLEGFANLVWFATAWTDGADQEFLWSAHLLRIICW